MSYKPYYIIYNSDGCVVGYDITKSRARAKIAWFFSKDKYTIEKVLFNDKESKTIGV